MFSRGSGGIVKPGVSTPGILKVLGPGNLVLGDAIQELLKPVFVSIVVADSNKHHALGIVPGIVFLHRGN